MSLFIVKPVGRACNERCDYCYYNKQDQNLRQDKIMDFNVLKIFMKKSIDFFKQRIDFVWHGGEPLLAGKKFFKKIILLQKKFNNDAKRRTVNGLQTNATIIDEWWADFLAKNKFSVGVSCDGPAYLHNVHRKNARGNDSFQDFYNGITLLRKHHLSIGAICVITKDNVEYPEELCEFFYQNGFDLYHPKICYELDETKNLSSFSISPAQYTNFLVKTFEWWLKKDDPNFQIRNLREIIKVMVGGKSNLCEFSGTCSKIFTVNHNGDIGPCDSFPADRYTFGNIIEQSWADIFKSDEYHNFLQNIATSREKCAGCKWHKKICIGGCLRYSYNYYLNSWHHNLLCESRKEIFSYIQKRLERYSKLT